MYKFWATTVIKCNSPKYSKIEEWLKIISIQINILQSMIYICVCVFIYKERYSQYSNQWKEKQCEAIWIK